MYYLAYRNIQQYFILHISFAKIYTKIFYKSGM